MTRIELASRLDVNPRTLGKWIEEGLPVAVRGRGGRPSLFDPELAQAWKEAREQGPREGAPVDVAQARAIKEHWQGRLAQQLHEIRSRTLLPAAEAEEAWSSQLAAARGVILTSYIAAADAVFRAATTDGLAGVERELRALAHGILRELADSARHPKKARKKKSA